MFDVVLLDFLLGLAARGGTSFTAMHAVYTSLWASSMEGSMYARREHFVHKVGMAIIVWSFLAMVSDAGLSCGDVQWQLRPHHEPEDFADLLPLARNAFAVLASTHACWLFRRVPALIVDGKWCVQTPVCNSRRCNPVYHTELQLGYFQGCHHRPARGSLYCHDHQKQCRGEAGEAVILEHRQARSCSSGVLRAQTLRRLLRFSEVVSEHGVSLEYKVAGRWVASSAVAEVDIQAYERSLLRKRRVDSEGGARLSVVFLVSTALAARG